MTHPRHAQSFAILAKAAAACGIPASGAEPIRFAENDIWRLPGKVVARIARPGQHNAARREIAVTRWLAENNVRAVQPLPINQPILAHNRAVTFWKELPPHHPGTLTDLAILLRQMHDLPAPDIPIGLLDPFVRVADRITQATWLNQTDRSWLLGRLSDLKHAWTELPQGRGKCVVHGDAWHGNCVTTDTDATPYLLDFERTALGPAEWDLTSTAGTMDTLGTLSPEKYRRYCDAYGHDVTAWTGYRTMRNVRELRQVSFAVQLADTQPDARKQAAYRVGCIQGREGPRPWRWTALP